MDRAAVVSLCSAQPGAVEEYPFGPGVAVYKVGGKMFALVSDAEDSPSISVKCDPGLAEALREQYPAVTPGYHLAKRHWNTVILDGSIPDDEIVGWIEESYALVVAALPRAARQGIMPARASEPHDRTGEPSM